MFFKGSRYERVATVQVTRGDRVINCKKVRFIGPVRADLAHRVQQGERLDQIADQHLQDSERFWRICDLNQALWPDDLIDEAGKLILIPPSEG